MSGQQVLQVVILRDGLLVGTQVFDGGQFSVGSANGSDLQLDDRRVQPIHARLYFHNGRVALQASGPDAPIFVNGHRVEACEVRPLDEVLCGPFVLKTRTVARGPVNKLPPEIASVLGVPPGTQVSISPLAQPDDRTTAIPEPVPYGRQVTVPAIRTPAPIDPTTQPVVHVEVARKAQVRMPSGTQAMASATPPAPHRPVDFLRTDPDLDGSPTELHGTPFGGAAIPGATQPSARALAGEVFAEAAEITDPGNPLPSGAGFPWSTPTPVAREAEKRAAPPPPPAKGMVKDRPRLRFELQWGGRTIEVRSFKLAKRALNASARSGVDVPLWGFPVVIDTLLAEVSKTGARLHVPGGADLQIERGGSITRSTDRAITVDANTIARITHGEMTLLASIVTPERPAWRFQMPRIPYLFLASFLLCAAGAGAFIAKLPAERLEADFKNTKLDPIAVKLIMPEPKKAEKAKAYAKEKLAASEKGKTQKAKKEPTKQPKAVASKNKVVASSPALSALNALTAGGATSTLFAAADKASGGGKKGAKNDVSLLGGLGSSNAIGSAGVKLGGGFGGNTLGGELLRGNKGIGALGTRNIGSGKVGGTVTRATSKTVAVKGSIDREAVANVVNAHLQTVRGCYERALIQNPGLAGKVVLEWVIGANGSVQSAKTKSSTLRNPTVESCILKDLKSWKFPSPKGGSVIVSYPFLFNSVGY